MREKFIAGQSARIKEALKTPKTMLQVANETGIERANICWEVHDLRKQGAIYHLGRGICPISKCRATFHTTSQQQWQYLVYRMRPELEKLDVDTQIEACKAIQSYYLNHYNPAATIVPPTIREYWENTLKPLIDEEVKL